MLFKPFSFFEKNVIVPEVYSFKSLNPVNQMGMIVCASHV